MSEQVLEIEAAEIEIEEETVAVPMLLQMIHY